ncbi:MAG TPA: hypothetical protein VLZ55_08810 [Rhodanobacter sp.]|jgi:hypothetical protein|nr:hypothetical protein [Rhodanobacter sp.]
MRNEADGLTRAAVFGSIPRINDHLFEVRAGLGADDTTTTAACLAESIERMADIGVQDGMDSETAYLVSFAASAIQALMHSVEGAYPRKAVQS